MHPNHLRMFIKLSTQFIWSVFVATFSLSLCTSTLHAESSNVMGEPIDNANAFFKPNGKDSTTDNKANIKKSAALKLSDTFEKELHDASAPEEPIAVETDDLWLRIKNGYAMPELNSSLVKRHEDWYSARPDYIKRMVERSQKYLFHIVEEVEKRNMPTEIALLPMIESAYHPQANSTSRASGIWQFVPATGKHFGLKHNWWVDNRRDITSATDAALTYLQKLYGMFGSWDLALAAYNAGEGTIGRAIERNRKLGLPTDYDSLDIPEETKNYVPKLQAIKNLMSDPEKYGLKVKTIANTAYFTKVSAPAQIDAHLAAKLAEISDEEFLALNPSSKRPVLTGNGEKHEILLPILAAETFKENLATYDKPLVSWRIYVAKRGEKLRNIASKFGMKISQLRSVNNLPDQNKIKKSTSMLVPNGNKTDVSTPQKNIDYANNNEITPSETNKTQSASDIKNKQYSANIDTSKSEVALDEHSDKIEFNQATNVTHTVKKGETIGALAKRYHVSVKEISSLNSLRKNKITVGQTLKISRIKNNDDEKKSKPKSRNKNNTRSKNSMKHQAKKTNANKLTMVKKISTQETSAKSNVMTGKIRKSN